MKVLTLISGGDVGGAKTHVLSLISQIMQDCDVTLVCFMEAEFSQDARSLGIRTLVLNKGVLPALKTLRKMVRSEGYDVIHCHGSRGNMMGMLLKKLGVPVLTTVHSDNRLDYLGRPFGALIYGNINRLALRRIRYHIGVSDTMADLLVKRGYDPYGIYTIYNGLDFTPTAPNADRTSFWTSVGANFPTDAVVVGIAARLDPVKSVETLITAYARVRRSCEKLRLLIAGDGQQRRMLEQLAASLGVADGICFAGWVQDMDTFYHCIDINALTSLSETFPYAITEGARALLPTVSSRVGGVPKLIDHGINGYLFEPGDADTLAECLKNLYESPERRRDFGRKLHDKAERDFSLDATRRAQMDIYRSILEKEARRKSGERQGVVICGAYGRGNAGDEAILEAIVGEMRSIDGEMTIHVMSRRPREAAVAHRVRSIYTFHYFKYRRAMRQSKLFINGGGSLMQDVTSSRSLLFYLSTLRTAKKAGCKVHMYGCGFGPILRRRNMVRVTKALDRYVDAITLREDDSLQEIRAIGVTKPEIVLAADPALNLRPDPDNQVDSILIRSGIPLTGDYICFTVRKWPGFQQKIGELAAAAEYAYRVHGLTPVFVPIEPRTDVAPSRAVMAKLTVPCYLAETTGASGAVIGVYSRMRVVLSMRLHGLVFASSQGVPLIGVVYDKKVSSFLKYLGQDLFCDRARITAEELCAFIDEAVRRSGDREALLRAVDHIRITENRNVQTAEKLLHQN